MYEIEFSKKASKQLRKLDRTIKERVKNEIKKLKKDPYPVGHNDIRWLKNCVLAKYRARVNGYRILYDVYNSKILIILIRKKEQGTYK